MRMQNLMQEHNLMRKRIINISTSIIVIFVVVAVPVFVDHFIIGNNLPSNIDNPTWMNFLGSYLGGIFGGVATLFAFIQTFDYYITKDYAEKITAEENKRLSLLPYIQIYITDYMQGVSRYTVLSEGNLTLNSLKFRKGVVVKNIGLGSAVDLELKFLDFEIPMSNIDLHLSLAKDQEFNFNVDVNKNYGLGKNKFQGEIKFDDLLGNTYVQHFQILADANTAVVMIKELTKPSLVANIKPPPDVI